LLIEYTQSERILPQLDTAAMSPLRAIVQRIDLVNREVAVIADGTQQVVTVPADCAVFLRGEPVKLRMLQPGDLVKVAFYSRAGTTVARRIEVEGGPATSA
jgi:hypothetical protein